MVDDYGSSPGSETTETGIIDLVVHDLGLDDEAEFHRRYAPRHLWHAIPLLIAMVGVWVIMNEHLNLLTIVSGVIVGIIALVVTHLVIGRSYTDELWLGFRAGIIFIPYLIGQIILAAITMVKVIVTGRDHFVEYVYHSTLEDDFSVFLFATSIILTPGSMSLSREGNDILVLSVDENVEEGRAGCAQLERGIAGLNNPIFGARPIPHNPAGQGVPPASSSNQQPSDMFPMPDDAYQPGVHDELS